MTTLDIALLLLIGLFAVRGFISGFVTEAIRLGALVAGIVAVRLFHAPVTNLLSGLVKSEYAAALLAFALTFGIVYGLGKALAHYLGGKSKGSVLGMVDRLLGMGFGAVKGLLIATIGFVLFSICFDALYGAETPRPEWVRLSRSEPLLSASGAAMSQWLAENSRHGGLLGGEPADAMNESTNAGE